MNFKASVTDPKPRSNSPESGHQLHIMWQPSWTGLIALLGTSNQRRLSSAVPKMIFHTIISLPFRLCVWASAFTSHHHNPSLLHFTYNTHVPAPSFLMGLHHIAHHWLRAPHWSSFRSHPCCSNHSAHMLSVMALPCLESQLSHLCSVLRFVSFFSLHVVFFPAPPLFLYPTWL